VGVCMNGFQYDYAGAAAKALSTLGDFSLAAIPPQAAEPVAQFFSSQTPELSYDAKEIKTMLSYPNISLAVQGADKKIASATVSFGAEYYEPIYTHLGKLEDYGGPLPESYTSGRDLYLEALATDEQYRGRGLHLARRLGSLAEIYASLSGKDGSFLWAGEESVTAHLANGYELTGETRVMRWEDDDGVVRDHFFRGLYKVLGGGAIEKSLQNIHTREDYQRYVAERDAIRLQPVQ